VERLLVVRLGSLGDLIHTLPAVAALRRAYPSASIDWLTDESYREFLGLVPVLSRVVPLRGRTAAAWLRTRRELQAARYDVALDFQGLIKSATLARLSGASRVLGFERSALREPAAAAFYTSRVRLGDEHHVIDKNLALAAAVGASIGAPEFPIRHARSAVADWLEQQQLGKFAVLNPGAAWPNKRWPPARFAELAGWLHASHGMKSVVVWGPGEQALADDIVSGAGGGAVAAPETRILDLLELLRSASLMVSGDTGPTHIAGAVGTPIVALFGPTDPQRNGPWSPSDVTISRYDSCPCPYARRCKHPERWCLESITVRDVQQAVGERLAR
jgi:heptosyltransferase-1